jgi:translation initiation factor 3 subunit A
MLNFSIFLLNFFQEAFRSVEDVHGLMSMVKKMPKPSVLVVYYAKLTEIFWISDSLLYHAYAWLKLFNLQKSYNKNLSQKDLQLIASSVLLAALSVAPYDKKYGASYVETENEKDRNLRMANLVNFSLDSKRENRELVCLCTVCALKVIFISTFIILTTLSPFCTAFKSISSFGAGMC